MKGMICGRARAVFVLVTLATLSLLVSACGGNGNGGTTSWEDDPIVPGYSIAEINIGDPFSAVKVVHGEPDEHRKDGGYLLAYYQRTRENGQLDDPESWQLVVTCYDNGNGYLDDDDEVGAVEVSAPYGGLTSGGNGLGDKPGDIEDEFGPCPGVTPSQGTLGERLELYSYIERGVEFLTSEKDGVITVIVTAYGGLRQVNEPDDDQDAQGGLFGIFGEDPVVPGQSVAGIHIGDDFAMVKQEYGIPNSSGFTTEGFVCATYTGGYGSWKLNLYLEDKDENDSLGDYDSVVSISVRSPYAGRTAGGVGIGSAEADVLTEFGTPQNESTLTHQGEEMHILEYNSIGIVFAIKTSNTQVEEIDVNVPL
ncbi:MAG: hypothetical protein SWK76_06385 [Actinomycetota bacterium]|nr:hypothetical protein [Actinomycetota bacterium]